MRYYDDIAVGDTIEIGSHHFTQHDIKRFATAFDPQPFHLDEAAAAKTHFGKLSASGWHTSAAFMRLYVGAIYRAAAEYEAKGERPPRLGPSPGFTNLRWHKPVCVDDVIGYRVRCTGKRVTASKPGWGLVFNENLGTNQRGDLVFSFDSTVFVERRRAG